MVIKNCEDKYTYLFRVTKGLKTINAKTTTFSGSRFLVVFLILNSLDQCKIPFVFDIIGFGVLVKVCFV